MPDIETVKPRSQRRGILTMLVIGVFLFFAIYYVVLKNFNMEAKKEIASRLRNVNSCIDVIRDKMADTAWWVSARPDIISAIENNNTNFLETIGLEVMARTRASTIAILTTNGITAAWGNTTDTEETLKKFHVVQLALSGQPAAGLEEDPSLEMALRAACPVKSGNRIIGAVIVGMNIFSDHSFVDGVIKNFGLVCSVFHNDIRISTTIYKEGQRALGTKLNNAKIQSEVLVNGGIFEGRNKAVGKEYDTAYWPLRNIEGKIIGVVGIGKDRETITRIFLLAAVVVLIVAGFAGIITTRESFRLQSLILLIIVPALVLITGIAGWLLYRDMHTIIIEGFNRKLYALSTTTASCLDGDRLRHLLNKRDESHPDYSAYLTTLRDIQKQKDVTYLYTFILGGKKDIVYIIDASPGEDFCPLGYEENLPMQNIDGLRRVAGEGIPYISEIQEYERYGLLKVSAAPVYGATNNIQALTGVDINISVIKKKLNKAISHILGVGAFALFLAGLTTMWFSRNLIRPLTMVKSGALRMAAGDYERQIAVSGAVEIEALASAFNRVGNTIGGILQKAAENHNKLETERRRTELARELAEISPDSSINPAYRLMLRWTGGRADCTNASGAVTHGTLLLAWLATRQDNGLYAIKTRRDIAATGARLLQKYNHDKKFIISSLRNLFKDTVHTFILVDADTGTIHPIARQAATALLIDSSGNMKETTLSDDGKIPAQTGSVLVLSSQISAEAMTALAAKKPVLDTALTLPERISAIESGIRSLTADAGELSDGLIIVIEWRDSK